MPGPALAWPRMGESGSRGALWASQGRLPWKPLPPAFDCHCSWSAFGHSDGRVRGQWDARFQLLGRYTGGARPKGARAPPLKEGGRAGPAQGASPGRDPRRSSAPHRGPLSCCSRATGDGHGLHEVTQANPWKGRGHHGKPRAGPQEHPGQASRPLDQEGAAPTSGEAGSLAVAGSQHPAPLTDCFQHSEERLAPDSGVSEASFV